MTIPTNRLTADDQQVLGWIEEALVTEDKARAGLHEGLVSAGLIMAGIVGAGGLLYFRAEVWALATGDPVTFGVVLVMLLMGSLLAIRARRL